MPALRELLRSREITLPLARSRFLLRDHTSSGEITFPLARSRFLWRDHASSGNSGRGSGTSGLIQQFSKLLQTLRAYQSIIAGPALSPLAQLEVTAPPAGSSCAVCFPGKSHTQPTLGGRHVRKEKKKCVVVWVFVGGFLAVLH